MNTRWLAACVALVLSSAVLAPHADAKRLGGGKSVGMQRQQAPERAAPQTPPAQQPAAPATAGATATKPGTPAAAPNAVPPRRSWMAPLAGLAAGLGLAALASSLGFGEGLAQVMTALLIGLVAFFVLRFVLSRLSGRKPALAAAAGAAAGHSGAAWPAPTPGVASQRTSLQGSPATGATSVTGSPLRPINIGEALGPTPGPAHHFDLPADFDRDGFERIAKMVFIRMQAAGDAADLDDLRQFTTPEMFAAIRLDLQDRGGVAQRTDVERVDAELVDFTSEATRQVASVRFRGQLREESDGPSVEFDEIWHLVKPLDDSRNWAIAGIQQPQPG